MMHIVVDNQDALQLVRLESMLCSQRHIIKIAITIEFGLHGMMARRSYYGHAILRLPQQQLVHQLYGRAAGQERQPKRGLST